MTIFCKLCERRFSYSAVSDETAQRHVMSAIASHLPQAHPQAAQEISEILQLCGSYLLLKKYVMMPETETALRGSFQEIEQALLQVFDLAPAPAPSVPA